MPLLSLPQAPTPPENPGTLSTTARKQVATATFLLSACPARWGTPPCHAPPAIARRSPPSGEVPVEDGSPTHLGPGPWCLGCSFIMCPSGTEDSHGGATIPLSIRRRSPRGGPPH